MLLTQFALVQFLCGVRGNMFVQIVHMTKRLVALPTFVRCFTSVDFSVSFQLVDLCIKQTADDTFTLLTCLSLASNTFVTSRLLGEAKCLPRLSWTDKCL